MARLIVGYRDAILDNRFPELSMFGGALAISVIALLLGVWVFRRQSPTFADYL